MLYVWAVETATLLLRDGKVYNEMKRTWQNSLSVSHFSKKFNIWLLSFESGPLHEWCGFLLLIKRRKAPNGVTVAPINGKEAFPCMLIR
jgi:hypothetical protein